MTYLPISTFDFKYLCTSIYHIYDLNIHCLNIYVFSGLASWRGTGAWRSARIWRAAAAPRTRSARRTAASGRRWVLRNCSYRHLLRDALRREQNINNDSFRTGFKMCKVLTAAVGKVFSALLIDFWPRECWTVHKFTLQYRGRSTGPLMCALLTHAWHAAILLKPYFSIKTIII